MVDGCVQSVPGLCVLCVHACVRCEQLLLSDMAAACFCAGVRCGALLRLRLRLGWRYPSELLFATELRIVTQPVTGHHVVRLCLESGSSAVSLGGGVCVCVCVC